MNNQVLFTTNHNNVFGSSVPDESGIYNVVVSAESIAKNSKAGNPMASMKYTVLDGTQKGKNIFDRLVWSTSSQEAHDLSIKRFNTVLMAAGCQDGIDIHSIPEFVQMLNNQRFAVETEWQKSDYNGNYYLTVTRYRQLLANGSQPDGKKRPTSDNNGASQSNNAPKAQGNFQQGNNPQGQQAPFNQGNSTPDQVTDADLPF